MSGPLVGELQPAEEQALTRHMVCWLSGLTILVEVVVASTAKSQVVAGVQKNRSYRVAKLTLFHLSVAVVALQVTLKFAGAAGAVAATHLPGTKVRALPAPQKLEASTE